eukprot:scaffold160383_cov19-Tisochrysis_lutea.AAC.1
MSLDELHKVRGCAVLACAGEAAHFENFGPALTLDGKSDCLGTCEWERRAWSWHMSLAHGSGAHGSGAHGRGYGTCPLQMGAVVAHVHGKCP